MSIIDRVLRFLLGDFPDNVGEVPMCNANYNRCCTNKRCSENFVHCGRCHARVSEWFTPEGELPLWCRACNTQTEWNSHKEFRTAHAHSSVG